MTCKFWGVTASKRSFVESFSSYPPTLKHKQRFTQEIIYLYNNKLSSYTSWNNFRIRKCNKHFEFVLI